MVTKTKAAQKEKEKEEAPEKEGAEAPDTPLPLLDLSDAAVKKLIRTAKKRGYVTHDQINSVLPSEEVNSEQIEDILAMFSEMGVNVVETEEATEEGEEQREEADEEPESEGGDLVEVQQKVPAKSEAKEPTERTDDPVRMYLREMGSVELLSREGEIAIAKRIEAGREAMIAGLCESPLTFQAIIIWRDELNEGKVFLRDIIDLEATYAGPDAKAMPAPVGPDGQPIPQPVGAAAAPGGLAQTPAPPAAPASATPFKPASERANGEEAEGGETPPSEGDFDDDDMENSLSLAAIEAELKPKVVETFDNIADAYKRLRRLQDQDIQIKLQERLALARAGAPLQEAQGRHHRRGEVAPAQPGAHRCAGRAALRHQQAPGRLRGPPDAAVREPRRRARGFPAATTRAPSSTRAGSTGCRSSLPRAGRTSSPRTRTRSSSTATRSRCSPARPGSRSASSARSCTWCRRASAKRARPRRRWWRRTCAS